MDSSEELIALLKRCTVRLRISGEHGTGFFVAPSLILTCAHLVGNVLSDRSTISVHWEDQIYSAKLLRLLSEPYPDLALLKLENAPSAHPCAFLHEAVQLNDNLYSYGYPKLYPDGDPSTFVFEGMAGDSLKLMKFKLGEARQGFSGAPLLNQRTGGVCGIMKLTRGENTLIGGRGVPTSIIFEQFPELIALQEEFHQKDSRWYGYLSSQQRQLLSTETARTPSSSIEVYYSFAKEDEKLAKKLQRHLILLKRKGYIIEWHPGEVVPGEEPNELNKQHLIAAHIILLLVSPDFIFEKELNIQDNFEVKMAMDRSKAGAVVIPIKLRPINNWDLAPFGRLVSLPRNGKPVIEWKHTDAAFAEIAGEIRKVVDTLRKNVHSFSNHP